MKQIVVIHATLVIGFMCSTVRGDDVTLESVPPVVIGTTPQAGDSKVDPTTAEVTVTFSKEMQSDSWSWGTASKETFPTLNGKPRYIANRRTCVLPVKLEPGKTYALWVNSDKLGNFKDTEGRSALPYLLVFKTRK